MTEIQMLEVKNLINKIRAELLTAASLTDGPEWCAIIESQDLLNLLENKIGVEHLEVIQLYNDVPIEEQVEIKLNDKSQYCSDGEEIILNVNHCGVLYKVSAICHEKFSSMGWHDMQISSVQ